MVICLCLLTLYLIPLAAAVSLARLIYKISLRGSVAVIPMDSLLFLEMSGGELEFRPQRSRSLVLLTVFGLAAAGVIWITVSLIGQNPPSVDAWLWTIRATIFTLMTLGFVLGAFSLLVPTLRAPLIHIDARSGNISVRRGLTEQNIGGGRVIGIHSASPRPRAWSHSITCLGATAFSSLWVSTIAKS